MAVNSGTLARSATADSESPKSIAVVSTADQSLPRPRSQATTRPPLSPVRSDIPGSQVAAHSSHAPEALESQPQVATLNFSGTAMVYINARRVHPLQLAFAEQALDVHPARHSPARERRVSIDSIDWCDPCDLTPGGKVLICFFAVCMEIGAAAGLLSSR